MKAFIDLGAYTGDTIKEFYNWGKLVDDPNEYEVWAFEPNPNLKKQMEDIASQHLKVKFKPWAAWIYDGEVEFAIDGSDEPMGSTLEQSKANVWDGSDHINVKCFDFSKWLIRFTQEDEVIVKMDIEGAEFKLLQKMLSDGTIHIPKTLLVEFHPNKAQDYTTTDKDNLIRKLQKKGIHIKEWH